MFPYVTPSQPRLRISVLWGDSPPLGEIQLYVRRVGQPAPFAVYAPIDESAGQLTFQFDALMFIHAPGRYEGRLVKGVTDIALIEFDYRDTVQIVKVDNPNVYTGA